MNHVNTEQAAYSCARRTLLGQGDGRDVRTGKAALPIEGVPIEVSGKVSEEFKSRLKKHWEENKESKYQWSQFIVPGELRIAPNKQNHWALKKDEDHYFISITTQGGS